MAVFSQPSLGLEGFTEDVTKGTVLGVIDKVIAAVKSKAIPHFFLVGGCDGGKTGRNYSTECVEKVAADCVVRTFTCGNPR
jgi:hydroxylamine reductase